MNTTTQQQPAAQSTRKPRAHLAAQVSPFLPEIGFVRLPQVLAVLPIGKSSWWAGIKAGKYPQGVKIGPKTTAWTVESIRNLLASM